MNSQKQAKTEIGAVAMGTTRSLKNG